MSTTTMKAAGTLLTASVEDRTLTYRLLPYGETGRTNMGRLTASKGAVKVPDDPSALTLNLEHDRTRPVGKGVAISETDTGLEATFRVARTRAGDDLLEEAAEGLRAGVSVEVDDIVTRSGQLMAGVLSGAAAVVAPAFPSAQLVAADVGELPEAATDAVKDALQTALDVIEDNTEGDEPETQEEATMADSTATATAPVGGLAASRTETKVQHPNELFRMLATAHREGGERRMLAALSDIVPANTPGTEVPQYVGELWNGRAYQRKIIPLFNHADLTSYKVKGWRWVNKPEVAPYAGNKTDVPSNPVSTEQVDIDAERIAGAHDIDRKYRDFNDEAFFSAYFAAMTESYAKVSDAQVLADILAAATPVTRGTVPTDVSPGMTSIVDGALAVLTATDTVPSFAVVAADIWREVMLTRNEDTLAYLNAALGLDEGTVSTFRVVPSAALTAGSTLVGAKDSVTVHELGGGAPIRVEAQDIAKGGIDEGVFGYYAVNVHDAEGLALVTAGV
ncbi:hypothetical protein [Georgenia sp. H159]|uniref:phage major capsid protein n=1 Tax=Georgenia sp. H159 TaxID=3076115 RepID=UPI002D785373|nr:hypothetical protein [Georgenia sp. H159]